MIFNWILIKKFAIGTPILKKNEKKILESNGIKTILDLRNSSDFDKSYKEKYFNYLSDFKYINIPLPDHRNSRLASNTEIRQAVDSLHLSLSNGPVFMHCHAAMERSPLISIAYLKIKLGLSLLNAIDYVKQQNKSTVVNPEQLKYINV